MAVGSPQQRITPNFGAYGRGPGQWGVQPGGGALPALRRALPPERLDYLHKLTSTTMLIVAAIAFVVFYRGRPRRALRALIRKQVGDIS